MRKRSGGVAGRSDTGFACNGCQRRPLPRPPRPLAGASGSTAPPAALHRSSPSPLQDGPAGYARRGTSRDRGTPRPHPAPHATSASAGAAARPGGEPPPGLPARPRLGRRPPSSTSQSWLTARVTGRSRLYLKCSFFICRLKTNSEEAKSKICPLPLAT